MQSIGGSVGSSSSPSFSGVQENYDPFSKSGSDNQSKHSQGLDDKDKLVQQAHMQLANRGHIYQIA